ncbi:unnamed protein product [Angiostrongylus costaricensis]|uniref:Protein kinase domain-containing protein n=1 Tax=Angiostrongylus costaricensis TaxID=334426 RepID=A0A0R3PRB6_ANGCS|nr:unnamed protein product [Angiostrongylus costaricensis]
MVLLVGPPLGIARTYFASKDSITYALLGRTVRRRSRNICVFVRAARMYFNDLKFTLFTVTVVAVQTVDSFKEVHDAGFVHRDVKPSNYAIGLPGTPKEKLIYILDFRLARSFRKVTPDGREVLRNPRKVVQFRKNMTDHGPTEREKTLKEADLLEQCPKEFELYVVHLEQERDVQYTSVGTQDIGKGWSTTQIKLDGCWSRIVLDLLAIKSVAFSTHPLELKTESHITRSNYRHTESTTEHTEQPRRDHRGGECRFQKGQLTLS